jgi:prevent-host-death family protein
VSWTIAEAKQHFSDVVRRAAREPQLIVRRERPVAAVIGPGELEEFRAWKASRASRTTRPLADALAELSRICEEEGYALELPERADRPNPLLPEATRASRRHQRRQ